MVGTSRVDQYTGQRDAKNKKMLRTPVRPIARLALPASESQLLRSAPLGEAEFDEHITQGIIRFVEEARQQL